MNRAVPALGLVVLLALLAFGFGTLYRLRLSQGAGFPAYSSLRADPLGTRALYEALARLPGWRVERRFAPLEQAEANPPRTIVLAGVPFRAWDNFAGPDFDALEAAVRAGSRLVIVMQAEVVSDTPRAFVLPVPKDTSDEKSAPKPGEKEKGREKEKTDAPPEVPKADLARRWGITLGRRELFDRDRGAERAVLAPATLPASLAWESDLFFEVRAGSGWRTLYRRGGEPVVVEIARGLGSIVLAADSYFLSNEALQRDRSTALLAWLVGPNTNVEFDESHLGVEEDVGVAALARRYGLTAAAATLVLLAGLYIWRSTARFVPAPAEAPDLILEVRPTAGLEALLRRALPRAELASACLLVWRRSARASDLARIQATGERPGASPVEAYNAAVRALRRH